ncbi:glutamate receptor ionotropic, kainate 4-like [Penaeus chinensis]|uniref:glutamate receptor ionotropic, kainate 4-like n=1 Tax=Penaeus chinensis TaxID=139456 RepID=UPI001FB72C93|nr:glutamate receptor ionotropic, kainate 4-like [Penaeus chinensis]
MCTPNLCLPTKNHLGPKHSEAPPFNALKPRPSAQYTLSLRSPVYQHRTLTLKRYRCGRDPNRQWGTRKPDGTWTGIVGSLVAGDADVLMGSLDLTYPRSKILDFTFALEESRFRLLLKRPNAMGNPWTGYTKEFSPGSWAFIVMGLVVGSASLVTVAHFSPREYKKLQFGETSLCVLGLLCGQGPTFNLEAISSRIVHIIIATMTQLIFFHYTSALISALATSGSPPKINSLQDILASSSHTLGLIKGTSTMDEFSSTSNPLYKDTWDKVVSVNPGSVVSSMEEGVQKAMNDYDFVFFIDEHVYNSV